MGTSHNLKYVPATKYLTLEEASQINVETVICAHRDTAARLILELTNSQISSEIVAQVWSHVTNNVREQIEEKVKATGRGSIDTTHVDPLDYSSRAIVPDDFIEAQTRHRGAGEAARRCMDVNASCRRYLM